MATTILIKRNLTDSNNPTSSDLEVGELGLNLYGSLAKLFTKNVNGTIVDLTAGIDNGSVATGVAKALAFYASANKDLSATDDGLDNDLVRPVFYYIEGQLRVSDGSFVNTNNYLSYKYEY